MIADALKVNIGDILPEYQKMSEKERQQADIYSVINSNGSLTSKQKNILTELITQFLALNNYHNG
jgi:hypothetical protein